MGLSEFAQISQKFEKNMKNIASGRFDISPAMRKSRHVRAMAASSNSTSQRRPSPSLPRSRQDQRTTVPKTEKKLPIFSSSCSAPPVHLRTRLNNIQ